MEILSVKNLTKTYIKRRFFKKTPIHALKGISFSVKKGEIFGILGPNGAGKSTTMNILADLLSPDKGKVTIFGKDFFKNATEIKDHMALINGYASYPIRLSLMQNMLIYARIYNVPNAEKRIEDLLNLVGLKDYVHTKFSQLSSGQRTRVNIVRGLLHKPKLILMDEPTIGLDPHIAKIIRKVILDINKKDKATILFTSHNMKEVEEVCDRVAFLKEGEILKIASVEELKDLIDIKTFFFAFQGKKSVINEILKKFTIFDKELTRNTLFFKSSQDFALNKLIIALVRKKITIDHLVVKRPSLEKIFIELAEGNL